MAVIRAPTRTFLSPSSSFTSSSERNNLVQKGAKSEENNRLRKKKKTFSKNINEFRVEVYRLLQKKKSGLLSAFVARPKSINFQTQFDGEEIILMLRRHWITNIGWLLISLLMVFSPLVLTFFPLISFLPAKFQLIVILMWYLIVFAFSFEKFLTWYFNLYIVTDERVVDIDFYNLLYKEISDAELEKIEDVTIVSGSVIQAIFNYGDIFIQTAAEKREFELEAVPNPALVAKILQTLRMEEKQETLEGRIK